MANSSEGSAKPSVLIIGGLGYIGRFLALYIHKNNLASEVRLVDKVLPQLAWLAPEFAEACSQDKFMQADASREQSLSRIFTSASGNPYAYVFNCGGETRYSQEDAVYASRTVELTKTLAAECARRKIPAYVEFSTGLVYKPPTSSTISAGGCTESAPLKPTIKLAKYKLIAEESLEQIRLEHLKTGSQGLTYCILRLAHVYGDYDNGILARGLCLARIYQSRHEELKWLYGKDLKVATVHVEDACSAAWLAAEHLATGALAPSAEVQDRIFNIVDSGVTSQGTIAGIVAEIFRIETGFANALVNAFARFNLDRVIDEINEDVLQPWADLLAAKNITRPGPISPFMEKELLKDSEFCLSAEKAQRVLGWRPAEKRKRMTAEIVKDVVRSYEKIGWWP